MVIITEHNIKAVQKLAHDLPPFTGNVDWMGPDASRAILIAIGAGPWNLKRRTSVQGAVLDWYRAGKYRDLKNAWLAVAMKKTEIPYPLEWQKKLFLSLGHNTHAIGFSSFCRFLLTSPRDLVMPLLISRAHDDPNHAGAKVLWMFARDFLKVPAFPIDRHVKRSLVEYGLPTDAWEMTSICQAAKVDPNDLNRRMFGGINPDWSKA